MNHRLILIVLMVFIVGFVAYSITNGRVNTQPAPSTTDATRKTDTIPNRWATGTTSPNIETGRYVPYTADAFDTSANKKRVLYFHALWCPECRTIDKEFQARANEIPTDVIIYKTDYDSETELKTRHGVIYQHTFVQVDAAGNAVTKWNGGGFDDALAHIK